MLSSAFASANWKWVSIAGLSVVASPLIWNIVARNEIKNKTLTRTFGSPHKGCYALAAWIFFSSLLRDKLIEIAIQKSNPASIPSLGDAAPSTLKTLGAALTGIGLTIVAGAYYRLR